MAADVASKTNVQTYRRDIDGLRAVAVLPVLLFHAGLGCKGGFVGVDVFFVISGFLISSLILKELGDGTFRLSAFWERRIRRIFPALMVVVLASIFASFFLYLPLDFKDVGKSVVSQAALISNFFFWRATGYFAGDADTKPLLHTWSLAVEEQFYLLFPLFLIFLVRCRRLPLSQTIFCLMVGSLTLNAATSYSHPAATFYLLPMRAWELLIGSWLAVTRGRLPVNALVRETTGWLGLGLVCSSVLFCNYRTQFPTIPACLGAALIIFSSDSKSSCVGRILAWKPLVFIGLISYSLYLWHWPLLVFAKYHAKELQSVGFRVAMLVASFALAILSWKYVETAFRKRFIFPKRRQVFIFAGGSTMTMLVLGLIANGRDGFPARFPTKAIDYAESKNHSAFVNIVSLKHAVAGQFIEFGVLDTNQPINVLIWGDSHAMSLTPVLDELCRQFSRRGIQATCSATAPVMGYISPEGLRKDSPAFANAVFSYVAQKHVQNVVLAAYWSTYPASDSLKTNLLATVRAFMALGSTVYVVKDVPVPGFDVPRFVALTAAHHGDITELGITPEKHQKLNDGLRETFEQISRMGATVLDPADYFLNDKGLYAVVRNDQVLYTDSHHLTVEGSRLLMPLFEPAFRIE